jgi:putative DNA primase/helicase
MAKAPRARRITLPAAQAAHIARLARRRKKLLVTALKTMAAELGYTQPLTKEERAQLKAELGDNLEQWRDTQSVAPVMVTRASSRLQRLWDLCIRIEKHIAAIEESETQVRAYRLAQLTPAQYDRVKREEANKLGIDLGTLNDLVAEARADIVAGEAEAAVVPWPHPVDGQLLIHDLGAAVRRHVVMSDDEAVAIAFWILHAWALDAFSISPRLLVRSVTKRAGKTTLRDVLFCVVPKPLSSDNATSATIFRATDRRQPTLLLDEADVWVRRDPQVRGLINSGHRRGGFVMRMHRGEDRRYSTFSALMLALIGRAPDTVEDRSIQIHLRRRRVDEPREPFSLGDTGHLEELARRARRWATDHVSALSAARPAVPSALDDRAADNFRPLFAIGDEVGLGQLVREVAERLAAREVAEVLDPVERLIVDIHAVTRGIDRISTAELVKKLAAVEGAPWAEWRGSSRPITEKQVSWLLNRELGIRSASVRFGRKTAKGYFVSQFADAFARYLRDAPDIAPEVGTSAPKQRAAPGRGSADDADPQRGADVPKHDGEDPHVP